MYIFLIFRVGEKRVYVTEFLANLVNFESFGDKLWTKRNTKERATNRKEQGKRNAEIVIFLTERARSFWDFNSLTGNIRSQRCGDLNFL